MHDHRKICDRIMRIAGRCHAEAIITSTDSALTRFADNVISQNVSNTSTEISVRVMDRGRVTRFSLNQPTEAALKTAFATALASLGTQKKDPRLTPLAGPVRITETKKLFFPGTAAATPDERAARIASLVKKCKKTGAIAYGTYETGLSATTVANSLGVRAFHKERYAVYSATVRHGGGVMMPRDEQVNEQTAIVHVCLLRDSHVRVTVQFEPPIDRADSAHVPGDVEALVNRMVQAAIETGAEVAS